MHLLIDIRSTSPTDPVITRYASNWVNLWQSRHPGDLVSYIHFSHQKCPENGKSIIAKHSWYWKWKSLKSPWSHEIFRCVNFSGYAPYDKNIVTINHIFDHTNTLYPSTEKSWIQEIVKKYTKKQLKKSGKIIVPSLVIWQETVDIIEIREDNIEILPYISFSLLTGDRRILHQLSISWPYWIYDGSYGSEANIYGLLGGYKAYRDLGGTHTLLLMWQPVDMELRRISDMVQKMNLTWSVRIIGILEEEHIESLYMHSSGWLYIGAYYGGGPRIGLARSHKIPMLISDSPSLSDYHTGSITIHPNHLSWLGQSLRDLEHKTKKEKRNVSNDDIMKAYEKIIAEKR